MRRPPRAGQAAGEPLTAPGEDAQAAARRLPGFLEHTYLAIQGPPGSGEMVVDLVAAGKQVGVTRASHKVIGELLQKVGEASRVRGVAVTIGQRGTSEQVWAGATAFSTNAAAHSALTGCVRFQSAKNLRSRTMPPVNYAARSSAISACQRSVNKRLWSDSDGRRSPRRRILR